MPRSFEATRFGSRVALCFLGTFALFAPAVNGQGGEAHPPTERNAGPSSLEARSGGTGAPLWVSAEAATRPDGTVDWELLGEEAHQGFLSVAEQPPIPYKVFRHSREMAAVVRQEHPDGSVTTWYHYGVSSKELPGRRWGSLDELARQAEAIYLGTVTGVSEGFFGGEIASLLTVRVEEVLQGSPEFQVQDELYVYYPEARFSIGELNFWKSNPAYPPRPVPGERVLVATERPPRDAGRMTVLPRPEALFVESRAEAGLSVKGGLEEAPGREEGLDELASRIQGLLAGEVPR